MDTERDYFEVGQSIYFWTLVKNKFLALVDPVDLEFHIQPPTPAALIVVPLSGLTRESLGRYSYEHVVDAQGLWKWAWHSTNPSDVEGDRFHVSNSSQP